MKWPWQKQNTWNPYGGLPGDWALVESQKRDTQLSWRSGMVFMMVVVGIALVFGVAFAMTREMALLGGLLSMLAVVMILIPFRWLEATSINQLKSAGNILWAKMDERDRAAAHLIRAELEAME